MVWPLDYSTYLGVEETSQVDLDYFWVRLVRFFELIYSFNSDQNDVLDSKFIFRSGFSF